MTIQCYWLAQALGLLRDVSHRGDGSTWEVSARCDEVFTILLLGLAAALLLSAFLFRLFSEKPWACITVHCLTAILFAYAISVAVGIGPYPEFYPQGGGFVDLSALEHALEGALLGILSGLTALCSYLGSRIHKSMKRRKST